MDKQIIYGRSQGSGADRVVEPTLKLISRGGSGHVKILIPRGVGIKVGTKANIWSMRSTALFGLSFGDGGRLTVHGSNRGNGSLFVLGSVDKESFQMLQSFKWIFREVGFCEGEPSEITFVGAKGSTPIASPLVRKKKESVDGEAASD